FHHTAPSHIYTLSLHDALPIFGPEIFTPENARTFGAFVGRRYAEQPIIWIMGGDRPIESDEHRLIVRAMAEGVREGDGNRHVMRSEEHTSELQSRSDLVCRLLL